MLRMILFLALLSLPLQGCYAKNYTKAELKAQEADPYTWDFGGVKEGEVLRHVFVLKNESGKIMTIKDIDTSCGCTVSQAKQKILLPAESTEIEVGFDTKGYSGLTNQYIYVHTDSLDNPIIRFIIKADVIK
jgi:hypothetical protein